MNTGEQSTYSLDILFKYKPEEKEGTYIN